MRVAISLLIILDLWRRSKDLVAHYTDFGVLPRAALIGEEYTRWRVSIHLANGSWEFQAVLFLIAGAFALALLVGYKTRIATIGSWLLLASLHSRNPILLDGGDFLLRLILFWAIFLPWGEYWSLDRGLRDTDSKIPQQTFSAATLAYTMQIVFTYWFSVLLKTGPEWRDGSAVYYTLHFDQFVTPVGLYLRQYAVLLEILTHSVFWVEIIGPLLLVSPIVHAPVRLAGIFLLSLMHIGIGMCINIGIFTWIAPLAMLGLLPSWFWEKISSRENKRRELTIYFDDGCSFCSRSVRLLKTFLFLPETVETQGLSDPCVQPDIRDRKSLILVDEDNVRYFKFDAVTVLAKQSALIRPLVPIFKSSLVKRMGDQVCEFVANHRRLPLPSMTPRRKAPNPELGVFLNVSILLLLGYVLLWNLATVPNSRLKLTERARAVGELLRIDQIWNMFAPGPSRYNGWFVIPGRLQSGEVVDLFKNDESVSWERPASVAALFQSYRWWKYLYTLWNRKDQNSWRNYSSYLCRSWNRDHYRSETLEELRIILIVEKIRLNNEQGSPNRFLIYEHRCGD